MEEWHEVWRAKPETKWSKAFFIGIIAILFLSFLFLYYVWGSSYSRAYGKSFPSPAEFLVTLIFGIIPDLILGFASQFPLLFIPMLALCFIFFLIIIYGIWFSFCHSRPPFIVFKEGVWINWDANFLQMRRKMKNFYLKLRWSEVNEISYKFTFKGPSGILFKTTKGNFVKGMDEKRIQDFIRAVERIGQGEKVKNLLETRRRELEKLFKVYPELRKVIKL